MYFVLIPSSLDLQLYMSYELYSYNYTNTISQENQEELKQILFPAIEDLYFSNIAFSLYCSKFPVSTFSGGIHLCLSSESYSFHYTNAIFHENQGKSRKATNKFSFRNIGIFIVLASFPAYSVLTSLLAPFQGVFICIFSESHSFYHTNANFQENQEKLETKFVNLQE